MLASDACVRMPGSNKRLRSKEEIHMRKTTPPGKTSAVLASLAVLLTAGAWQVVGADGRDEMIAHAPTCESSA